MTILPLLLALASPALDSFDEANLALTACGFAAHREAAAADRGLAEFKAALESRCAGEIAAMRRAVAALETGRGAGRAAAEARAGRLLSAFRSDFAGRYARRHEIEAQVKALEEALAREDAPDAR